jgi:enoyl-CoA hydratase/carnithine racemase
MTPDRVSEHVTVSVADGVMEILLDRPAKKNALSNAMYDRIVDALGEASASPEPRVVLIGSTGEDFTAGNDLADFAEVAMGGGEARAARFIEAIARFEKPLVAAVPGVALGVGMTMLLHCDLVYVSREARLSAPFVGLALVPEAGSSLLLPLRVGHPKAFEIFALGATLTGEEAAALGLANEALDPGDEIEAARTACAKLAKQPLGALIATKRLMRDSGPLLERMRAEGEAFFERLNSASAREAFTAFMERRPPDFGGLD